MSEVRKRRRREGRRSSRTKKTGTAVMRWKPTIRVPLYRLPPRWFHVRRFRARPQRPRVHVAPEVGRATASRAPCMDVPPSPCPVKSAWLQIARRAATVRPSSLAIFAALDGLCWLEPRQSSLSVGYAVPDRQKVDTRKPRPVIRNARGGTADRLPVAATGEFCASATRCAARNRRLICVFRFCWRLGLGA